jgi:hypothetical protein
VASKGAGGGSCSGTRCCRPGRTGSRGGVGAVRAGVHQQHEQAVSQVAGVRRAGPGFRWRGRWVFRWASACRCRGSSSANNPSNTVRGDVRQLTERARRPTQGGGVAHPHSVAPNPLSCGDSIAEQALPAAFGRASRDGRQKQRVEDTDDLSRICDPMCGVRTRRPIGAGLACDRSTRFRIHHMSDLSRRRAGGGRRHPERGVPAGGNGPADDPPQGQWGDAARHPRRLRPVGCRTRRGGG